MAAAASSKRACWFSSASAFSVRTNRGYWYPGWLISWEWVGVFAAFCLVRQLFRNEAENDGLLAVLLATGVSLAATGLIQFAVPPVSPVPVDPTVAQIFDLENEATPQAFGLHGPYSTSAMFAGFLLLLVPGIWTAAVVCYRAAGNSWRSWQARLTTLGLFFLAAMLLLIGYELFSHESFSPILNSRLDAWATTSTLIREHPFLGVGPGNFSRVYPTFLTSAAQGKIAEPPSFLLESAANYGMIGLAAIVTTIALLFWRRHSGPWKCSNIGERGA